MIVAEDSLLAKPSSYKATKSRPTTQLQNNRIRLLEKHLTSEENDSTEDVGGLPDDLPREVVVSGSSFESVDGLLPLLEFVLYKLVIRIREQVSETFHH